MNPTAQPLITKGCATFAPGRRPRHSGGGAIVAGLATLALSAWALGIQEFHAAMGRVLGRSTRG